MRLLLDTHVFLWLNGAPEKLSPKVLRHCENPANQLYLSQISPWEIQIKSQLGKLELTAPLRELVELQQSRNNLEILPIRLEHIYSLTDLPPHHQDPFDRLLVAQAQVEDLTFVTVDKQIANYSVSTLW